MTISHFREVIKDENKNTFENINTKNIRIQKVLISIREENDKLNILNSKSHNQINIKKDFRGELLYTKDMLEKVFKENITAKQISIIIQPTTGKCSQFFTLNKKTCSLSYYVY